MKSDLTIAWEECLASLAAQQLARDWIVTRPAHPNAPYEELIWLSHSKPEDAFLVILAIVRTIEDDETMYYFAAGPLEDFLGTHGPAFIDRIHAIAVRERCLRVFLGGVWQGSMQKNVWHRVESLAERSSQYGKWDSGLAKR